MWVSTDHAECSFFKHVDIGADGGPEAIALPVYAFARYTYSGNKRRPDGYFGGNIIDLYRNFADVVDCCGADHFQLVSI